MHRLDHVDLLAAQVPRFARMRIEAEHGDARRGDAETAAQIVVHDAAGSRAAAPRVIARGTSASGK